MIDEIEITKSDRSKCSKCKRKIKKDTKRGVIYYFDEYHHSKTKFVCKKCVIKILRKERKKLQKLRKELGR